MMQPQRHTTTTTATPSSTQTVLTPAAAVISSVFCSFLEVFLHSLLYDRSVYPPQLFDLRRSYGTVTHISRQPLLNAYIKQLVDSVQAWLVQVGIDWQ